MPGPYRPEDACLDLPALAAWLNITPRHVRRLVAERRIPFHKVGGLLRFVPAEITDWLDCNWHGTQDHGSHSHLAPAAPAARPRPAASKWVSPSLASAETTVQVVLIRDTPDVLNRDGHQDDGRSGARGRRSPTLAAFALQRLN